MSPVELSHPLPRPFGRIDRIGPGGLDGRATPAQIAVDLYPLFGDEGPFDVNESLVTLVEGLRGEPVLWELAVPGAVNADGELAEWMEVETGAALLTLECVGVPACGDRAFMTTEHFAPQIMRQGFIRTVRT